MTRRTVLVVVPSVAAGTFVGDAVSLLAGDRRVAIFFTAAPPEKGVRREFDLVLTADAYGMASVGGNSLSPLELALGDLCYDRLLASIPFRADYRRAVGLSRGQKLILVASTVDRAGVLDRLLAALPPQRYRVVAPRSPEVWRGLLVAANLVIGETGVVTRYGSAIGVPVLLASAEDGPRQGDVDELVRRYAPRLRPERPLLDQVETGMRADRGWQDRVAERIASTPGYAGDRLRRRLYELLDLAEPARAAPCHPVPLPSHHSVMRSSLVNSARYAASAAWL